MFLNILQTITHEQQQVFGIAFTSIVGDLIYNSVFTANMFMIIALVVGTIMTVCMKCNLKRQQASKKVISLHRELFCRIFLKALKHYILVTIM